MGRRTEERQLDLGASLIVTPNADATVPPSSHRYLCRILPMYELRFITAIRKSL